MLEIKKFVLTELWIILVKKEVTSEYKWTFGAALSKIYVSNSCKVNQHHLTECNKNFFLETKPL